MLNKKTEYLELMDGEEPHLLYEHVRAFYELFKKIGKELKNKYPG